MIQISSTVGYATDGPPPARPAARPSASLNILPRGNVYAAAALRANEALKQQGLGVLVAAVRAEVRGELEVAVLVSTQGEGTLREALETLPGPAAVRDPIEAELKAFG